MSCQCVRCGTCKGFGSIHDPFDYSGYPDERCMDCDGSGLTEECDECMQAREDDYERSVTWDERLRERQDEAGAFNPQSSSKEQSNDR